MPKFKVELYRDFRQYATMEIEATSSEGARTRVHALHVDRKLDAKWSEGSAIELGCTSVSPLQYEQMNDEPKPQPKESPSVPQKDWDMVVAKGKRLQELAKVIVSVK